MRGLTLRHLEAVAAVVRHGTVTGAARALGLTPSAMTTRLKELERLAGVPLFDRTGARLRVNQAGGVMLDLARQVTDSIEAAHGALSELREVTVGSLTLGITSTAKYFAPGLIADFGRRHPGVSITLRVGNRVEIIDSLSRMGVDVAIMGRPPARMDLVAEAFGDHPLIIVARPDHPLAARMGVTKAEVAREPFLMREEGSGTRTVFEEFFDGPVNRQTRFGIEIGSNETIKQGVLAGLGIALISAHTVAYEIETGRLAPIDVVGLPIVRKWFVAHHAGKRMLPVMKAFWQFTLTEGERHLPLLDPVLTKEEVRSAAVTCD